MPIEDRRQLAYDAATKSLARQDTTLGNLRNRSTALLTVAALVTSFGTGVGLINTSSANGHVFPLWAAYTLLGILVTIGALTVAVLWPVAGFTFGPSANYIRNRTLDGVATDTIVEDLTGLLIGYKVDNEKAITWRMRAFEGGALLLIAEVVVLILAFVLK